MRIKHIPLFLALLSPSVTLAEDVLNSQEATTTTVNTQEKAGVSGNAQDWGLTEDEWNQYQKLMQGRDGHWYPQLTPPAVLGLNAETPEEQQHFAEIIAKQEHDKVARELAFNNAVYSAMRRIYADEPMIKEFDKTPFNPGQTNNHKTTVLQTGDRLALFVDINKGVDIAALPKLLALVQTNTNLGLDIYCLGRAGDDKAISEWASINQIPASLVKNRKITLNQDDGKLAKTAGNVATPYLVLVRDGQSRPVSITDL